MKILKHLFRPAALTAIGIILVLGLALVMARHTYYLELQPVSNNQVAQVVTIKEGSTVKQIASQLKKQHLIRSSWAFDLYVKRNALGTKLQAGTYAIAPSQDVQTIVATLTGGRASSDLVTILPGRRIDQVRADFINAGFAPAAVDRALDPTNYKGVAILKYKPASVNTLEGLLWPDSYQKDPSTDPSVIIRESLVDMDKRLTPDIKKGFAAQGLSIYQGLVLSSIVVQEVNKPSDQSQAAQVFLSRLRSGSVLGSDVTARYGAIVAGQPPSVYYDSPYNTHKHAGLPPTPISSVSISALIAVAHPANTHWLYFVTGDNGKTYFSTNLQDHEMYTAKYCHKLCGN